MFVIKIAIQKFKKKIQKISQNLFLSNIKTWINTTLKLAGATDIPGDGCGSSFSSLLSLPSLGQ